MTNKEYFLSFCDKHPEISLFQQGWWMECVSGQNNWNVLLEFDENKEIIAFLPFMEVRKYFFNIILQPLLCQTNGWWLAPDINNQEEACKNLVNQAEALNKHWFLQFFPTGTSTHFWEEKGYSITQRRTFIIQDLSKSEDSLFESLSSAQKRQVRKAERNYFSIEENHSAEDFFLFHTQCVGQRGENNHNKESIEIHLINEALRRGNGTILYAKNNEGNKLSALFLVWDCTTAYYLIPAYNAEQKSSGASSFLAWNAILYAKRRNLKAFDFEGGVQESIANFYRQFGTEEIYYPQIEKINHPLIKLWKRLRKP